MSQPSADARAPVPEPEPPAAPLTRGKTSVRARRALIALVVLVALTVVGLVVSRQVKSPAEKAAETAAPPPTLLTASVERRVLTSTLIERGTVVADREVSVTPPAEAGLAVQVVTAVSARTGDTVRAGEVVLAISGRPLIALAGSLPAYRDLSEGATGPDVLQLQRALPRGVGSDKPAVFGVGTQAALVRLYRHVGYPPVSQSGKVTLPMAEVAYLPTFPAEVTQLTASVGDLVKAPLVSFASGVLHIVVPLDPAQAPLISRGMKADLVAEALGEQVMGTVVKVGTVTITQQAAQGGPSNTVSPAGDGTPYVPVEISPSKPLATRWFGQNVRTTLTSARTSGPVLVVPSAALSTAADGTTSVVVRAGNSRERVVSVRAGASGDGYVEVTPNGAELSAGELVVVGK